jgi:hypothetical protein
MLLYNITKHFPSVQSWTVVLAHCWKWAVGSEAGRLQPTQRSLGEGVLVCSATSGQELTKSNESLVTLQSVSLPKHENPSIPSLCKCPSHIKYSVESPGGQAFHPSIWGGRGRRIASSRPAWATGLHSCVCICVSIIYLSIYLSITYLSI